jgi:hypothetical protein
MLKVNKKYLNIRISKGQDVFILTEGLSEKRLQYLRSELGADIIEFFEETEEAIETPLPEEKKKNKRKSTKDDTSEN